MGKFGFVEVAGEEKEIFIPGPYLRGAMDGDTVLLEIRKENEGELGKKEKGKVVEVVKRSKDIIVGVFNVEELPDL